MIESIKEAVKAIAFTMTSFIVIVYLIIAGFVGICAAGMAIDQLFQKPVGEVIECN